MRSSTLFLFLLLFSLSFSASSLQDILKDLCEFLYSIVAEVAFLMILLSSIIYSASQFFGAELRARGTVWATSMFAGAIMGIVLSILLPWIVGLLLGYSSFDPNTCSFS